MKISMKLFDDRIRPELNFRELGGLKTETGKTVRHGVLLRSGGLHLFREDELEVLRSFHVSCILDLRERFSWKKKPDPEIGARHVVYDGRTARYGDQIDFTPRGFGVTGKKAEMQLEKLRQYYAEMPFGYDAFHQMIKELREGTRPFLIHCSKGKDRTGLAVMVILLLLGCGEETIMEDYLLTNEYRKAMIKKRMEEGRSHHPEDEGYMRLMFLREGVIPEFLQAPLAKIHARCGTAERYFEEEYGLGKDEMEAIRRYYLE